MDMKFPLKFGDAVQYELGEAAFHHIVSGEMTDRPTKTAAGAVVEKVLAGGLHTYDGWQAFVSQHPKIVHLLQFRFGVDDGWWFARELQNGVITLKIPRRLFNRGAANITQQPDTHYKSGYLWKTLFPRTYSMDDIVKAIDEALGKIDHELSDELSAAKPDGVLYGYTAVDDPFTAMLLRIQVRGNQIMSAFPAWDQPLTGNNGKPYSHVHSISFQIAESVVDCTTFERAYGPVFPDQRFDLGALLATTPEFIKTRRRRNPGDLVNVRHEARGRELNRFAERATPADLDVIDAYLADYPCAKDPFATQLAVYTHFLAEMDRDLAIFNAAQVTENVGECLWVLSFCDERFNTRRAVEAIVRFLGMALVHTGGLNTLMFKALIGDMVSLAMDHADPAALHDVLAALASSPCRAAVYTEFDLMPYVRQRDGEKFDPSAPIEMVLTVDHLLEFLAFNLGENYLLIFDKEDRLKFARSFFDFHDQWRLAGDVMSKLAGRDFDFFMPTVLNLAKLDTQTPPEEEDLNDIVYDYSRMMVMMRQRIVLEDPVAYSTKPKDIDKTKPGYEDLIRQKFKYFHVRLMHGQMLEEAKAYADRVGYAKLSKSCEDAINRLPKERVPLPKSIPDYIVSWRHKLDRDHPLFVARIEDIFDQALDEGQ
ncbi:hypothetical protein J2X16_003615 [Pelomonas aquatica]|uniref:Uncharacterized protein n=1 Tax=Pelomonas aquatica TaxID=431058 RepID=A0ABU1ZC99_9BURK|nr:hypothetical protein [Pelomonas aquatica]MDR7298252.1 hypothetical protein [Pelomonas aquatica]